MKRAVQVGFGVLRVTGKLPVILVVVVLACLCSSTVAQELLATTTSIAIGHSLADLSSGINSPIVIEAPPPSSAGVNWSHLFRDTLRFLAIEHAFRCATEQGTRAGLGNSFVRGYLRSVGNLHGWADGDPFYVNYIGHPMEGAVASFIWANNDPRYHKMSIGSDPRYWKVKLRGMAFAYLQSVQFEIGPVSEALIGNIQAKFPQQGFVDHVITPIIGTAWVLGEDALDRYVVRRIEARTRNEWIRLLVRAGLNPARSMANVVGGKVPWHRNERLGVRSFVATSEPWATGPAPRPIPLSGVDKFDFTVRSVIRTYLGENASGPCIGGEAVAAFRVATDWQAITNVGGCKNLELGQNVSGDTLDYLVGARWTRRVRRGWALRLELLSGGAKITQEAMFPDIMKSLKPVAEQNSLLLPKHSLYTNDIETNGFVMRAGLGLDVTLTHALALQVASLNSSHSWVRTLSGTNYRTSLQFSSGLVLRIGSWQPNLALGHY